MTKYLTINEFCVCLGITRGQYDLRVKRGLIPQARRIEGLSFKRYAECDVAEVAAVLKGAGDDLGGDDEARVRQCLTCGAMFRLTKASKKYCSDDCRPFLKKKIYKTCLNCGRGFNFWVYQGFGDAKRKFCYSRCREDYWLKIRNDGSGGVSKIRACNICGRPFVANQHGAPKKYCSSACLRQQKKIYNRKYQAVRRKPAKNIF